MYCPSPKQLAVGCASPQTNKMAFPQRQKSIISRDSREDGIPVPGPRNPSSDNTDLISAFAGMTCTQVSLSIKDGFSAAFFSRLFQQLLRNQSCKCASVGGYNSRTMLTRLAASGGHTPCRHGCSSWPQASPIALAPMLDAEALSACAVCEIAALLLLASAACKAARRAGASQINSETISRVMVSASSSNSRNCSRRDQSIKTGAISVQFDAVAFVLCAQAAPVFIANGMFALNRAKVSLNSSSRSGLRPLRVMAEFSKQHGSAGKLWAVLYRNAARPLSGQRAGQAAFIPLFNPDLLLPESSCYCCVNSHTASYISACQFVQLCIDRFAQFLRGKKVWSGSRLRRKTCPGGSARVRLMMSAK